MIVVKANRLIDGNGGDVIKDAAVVIDGSHIKQVCPAVAVNVPADTEVVDMGDCTLMPGLIDAHLHLMGQNVLTFKNYQIAQFHVYPQLHELYGLLHAQMYLEMGFTTLRDLPWFGYSHVLVPEMLAVRDAINNGILAGPRLKVAGLATSTASHLDHALPGHFPRNSGVTYDGPWELRKAVREAVKMGCDLIKTCASGGGGTDKDSPQERNLTLEELTAICEEAHYFMRPVAAHCFTPEAQKMAIRAGVDTIEHCVWTDDEALAMLKAEDKPVVPTLAHRTDRAIEIRRKVGTPEFVINKMRMLRPYTKETFQRLHQAGIKIVLGTDTQVDPEMGLSSLEMEVYVSYGMTPMEAIQTGTKNAAEAIGLGKDTGTLEPGKFADLIAVKGNPLDDIRLFQERDNIRLVVKEGKVCVDKRAGQDKHVIFDQSYSWKLA